MDKQHECSGGDATSGCDDPDTEGRHVNSTVSVTNLPSDFDSTSLKKMFMEVGPVIDCFIINGEGSDMTSRGFVQFTTTKDAENAIQEKNGFALSGKNIVVELANVQFGGFQNSGVAEEAVQQANDTKEKVLPTTCSDSTGLIDKRVKMLLSTSDEKSDPQMDFYGGPQIFNTVTWSLDGPAHKLKTGHLNASGHQRLWYFVRGQLLDVSSVLGPDMIDGREGWNYGVMNEHGCFEYYHQAHDCPYLANGRNWSMLEGCLPDYSKDGLCPPIGNHGDVEMGIPAARRSCKILSNYKGELPVPPEVRKACATLITYGIEVVKSNEVLEWTSGILENEEEEFTLNMLHPFATPRIKKWSLLGLSKLHYLVSKLNGEEDISPKMPSVTGKTSKGILDSICVIPYNQTLDPEPSKARDWKSFPLDQNADLAGGRPHFLSGQFVRPWPTNRKLAVLRSSDTLIDAPSILRYAKVQKQNLGSVNSPNAKTFSSGAGAALRIQKRNLGSVNIPNARTFSSGACAALKILKSFVK